MRITNTALSLSLEMFERDNKDSRKEQYHYSFLFLRNKLIAWGKNDYELCRKSLYFAERFNIPQKKLFPSLHSECDVISKLWGKVFIDGKLKLVNTRISKAGNFGISKPCPDCMCMLSALGITEIYWTLPDGSFSK